MKYEEKRKHNLITRTGLMSFPLAKYTQIKIQTLVLYYFTNYVCTVIGAHWLGMSVCNYE